MINIILGIFVGLFIKDILNTYICPYFDSMINLYVAEKNIEINANNLKCEVIKKDYEREYGEIKHTDCVGFGISNNDEYQEEESEI